ncbi:hypothetical protein BDF22DRAFT_739615 [Syncephalis plumigaleata]|nr:hypothetical protein BDF22DRAFT_739615 [Syncephalis plumigaleata]
MLEDLSALDFLAQSADLNEARFRFKGNSIQTFATVIVTYLFFWNTWRSLRLLYINPRSIVNWCCFVQSFWGAARVFITIANLFTSKGNCSMAIWMSLTGLTASAVCTLICMLSKAYMVQMRDKRILWMGILFIPLVLSSAVIFAFKGAPLMTKQGVCIGVIPSWLPLTRAIVEVSVNGVFSYIFLRAVIQQYRVFGSRCWDKLKSDGIFYLLCVAASSILCAILMATEALGAMSETLFLVDWLVASTLLIHQYQGMRTALHSNRPITQHQAFVTSIAR